MLKIKTNFNIPLSPSTKDLIENSLFIPESGFILSNLSSRTSGAKRNPICATFQINETKNETAKTGPEHFRRTSIVFSTNFLNKSSLKILS